MESAFSGCVPSDLGTAGTGTADQQQGGYRPAPRGTWERLRSPDPHPQHAPGITPELEWLGGEPGPAPLPGHRTNVLEPRQSPGWPTLCSGGQGRAASAQLLMGGPGNQAEPPLGKGGASFFPRPSASWLSAINMGKRSCQISLFLNFLGLSSNKPSQGLLPDRRNGHCPDTHCVLAPTRPFTKSSCFTSATAPSVDLHLVCP